MEPLASRRSYEFTYEHHSLRVTEATHASAVASAPPPSRDALIQSHLGLVALTVARMSQICSRGRLEKEDAYSYGVMGLIQAVDSYDVSRGASLSTFALPRIRGAILDAVRRIDPLPRAVRRQVRELDAALVELAHTLGRWPTDREIAVRTGLAVAQVRQLRANAAAAASLEAIDRETREDTQAWLQDEHEDSSPEVAIERLGMHQALIECLGGLAERDRQIVELYYGSSMTFREIGSALGLTESRVCQLHRRIMARLRESMNHETTAA